MGGTAFGSDDRQHTRTAAHIEPATACDTQVEHGTRHEPGGRVVPRAERHLGHDDLQAEILTAELADYPFESFEADAGTLKAYIPQEQLADCKGEVDALLAHYGVQGRYIAIETQNWNAVWESNFPPVDVEGRLLIRAPFHEPAPAGVMEVVVMPRSESQ